MHVHTRVTSPLSESSHWSRPVQQIQKFRISKYKNATTELQLTQHQEIFVNQCRIKTAHHIVYTIHFDAANVAYLHPGF